MEEVEALAGAIMNAAKESTAVVCRVMCGCPKSCGTEYGKKAFIVESVEDARAVAEEVMTQTAMLAKMLGPLYKMAGDELLGFRIDFSPVDGADEQAKRLVANMLDDIAFNRRADQYRKDSN